MDTHKNFIWITNFTDRPFEYGGISKFEIMLGQTLNYFVYNFHFW
jgi:hypothetical protein